MNVNNLTPSEAAMLGGVVGTIAISVAICVLIWYVLLVIASWKIFKKAGEPGWKAIIPIYNLYIMYKIVNMKGWFWGLLGLSVLAYIITGTAGLNVSVYTLNSDVFMYNYNMNPLLVIAMVAICILSIIIDVMYAYRTSKVFGHGIGYTIGLIFLPNIFWLILGFGKSKYDKKLLNK